MNYNKPVNKNGIRKWLNKEDKVLIYVLSIRGGDYNVLWKMRSK